MLALIFSCAVGLAAEAPSDIHVYRHALRALGARSDTSPADLPNHYVVARIFNEGVARLSASPWYGLATGWRLEFEGAIRARLRLPPWRINDVLVIQIGDERRVFLEVTHRLSAVGAKRYGLVELRFEGPSRLTPQIDRVTLVPLRFDVKLLNDGQYPYRRPVIGPAWARTKVFDIDNEMSPEHLIRLMVPGTERRLALVPADDVGHARLQRFLLRNGVTIAAPQVRAPTLTEGAPKCVSHLRIVR